MARFDLQSIPKPCASAKLLSGIDRAICDKQCVVFVGLTDAWTHPDTDGLQK